ncbi:MAG: hypothetical protein ACE5IJ_11325, partial [Thermoplasmata archaeon]
LDLAPDNHRQFPMMLPVEAAYAGETHPKNPPNQRMKGTEIMLYIRTRIQNAFLMALYWGELLICCLMAVMDVLPQFQHGSSSSVK